VDYTRSTDKLLSIFQLAMDDLPVHVWFCTDAETYGIVNRVHADFFGKKKEEMEFRKLAELFPPDVAAACLKSNLEAIESRAPVRFEEWITGAGGAKRLLSISKNARFDDLDNLELIVCVGEDITGARAALDALRAGEARHRQIISMISDIVWSYEVDSHGHFVESYMSPVADRLLGLPEGSVNNDFEIYFAHLHPDDFLRVEEAFQRSLHDVEKNTEIEFRVVRADGKVFWLHSRSSAHLQPNGHVVACGTCSDITARKNAEDELRTRDKQVADILANQSDLICRFLPDGTLTFANEAYRAFFGEAGQTRFHEHLASTDTRALDECLGSLTVNDPSATTEHSTKLPSGETRWLSWTHRALFDDSGSLREYQSVGRDVTELKAAEDRLIHEKWRLDCIIEATSSGTWQWDVTTGEMNCNDHWYEILGYAPSELNPFSREKWRSMVHPEDLSMVLSAIKTHFENDAVRYSCEYRMRHQDGRWIWVHDCGRVRAGRPEDGGVLMFGIHTDITPRREEQENREYHTRLLELILTVSGNFMNTPPDRVDDTVNLALTGIGEFESVDRCYVFLFDDHSHTTWSNTHEWCAPGVNPLKDIQQAIPTSGAMKWWLERLKADETIAVANLEELPPEAASERAVMEARSIRSFLVVPIRIRENTMGYLGLETINSYRSWSQHTVSLIRMAADIMSSAFERRESETLLAESENNYRTLFNTVDCMLSISDLEGRILCVSPSMAARLGYSSEEVKHLRVTDLHPFPLQDEARAAFQSILAGETTQCSLPLVTKGGVLIPVETSVWFGKWNGSDCIYAMSRDMSRESEALQKFDRFFRMIPLPLAVTSFPERRFLEVNEAFLKLTGYSAKEVMGHSVSELEMMPDPTNGEKLEKAVTKDGFARDMEVTFKAKDGSPVKGLFSGVLIEASGKRYFLSVFIEHHRE
jgi:PAS domain S-box-containing protein